MSNARSPRDVCSTTIGIKGISRSLLVAGGPQFRCAFFIWRTRASFLAGGPDRFARLRELRGDRLHVGDDAVDCLAKPQLRPDAVGAAGLHELGDVLLALAVVREVLPDFLVRDLDPEPVGDGL